MESGPDAGPPEPNAGRVCPDRGAAIDLDAAGAGQWEATCDACGRTWPRSLLLRAVPANAVTGPPADSSIPLPREGIVAGLTLAVWVLSFWPPAAAVLRWVRLVVGLLALVAGALRRRRSGAAPRASG